jgi:hypothetical protein
MEKMAKVVGVTTMVSDASFSKKAPPTLGNLAAEKGVPVLLLELIDGKRISEPSTTAGIKSARAL